MLDEVEITIVDRFGRRRRARKGEIPQDGETISIPVTLMDAAAREVRDALAHKYPATGGDNMITDAYGQPAGFRRGYVFDNNRKLADAAQAAYDEREPPQIQRMEKQGRGSRCESHLETGQHIHAHTRPVAPVRRSSVAGTQPAQGQRVEAAHAMTKFWARSSKFDVISNIDGSVVARNVSASEAATLLGGGVTADAVTYAISNFSFLDTGDYRVAGHGQITGGTL